MNCIAIIVAGGASTRAGCDKLWCNYRGKPLLCHSVQAFTDCPAVDSVVVCVRKDKLAQTRLLYADKSDKIIITEGGETRTETVKKALLLMMGKADDATLVAVHDGARPFVSEELIRRTLLAAAEKGSAVPCVSATDTLRNIAAENTPVIPRENVVCVQTPQCFLYKKLLNVYQNINISATDDATLYEKTYGSVNLVEGDPSNVKITYPADVFRLAEQRSGVGFDVHRLQEGLPLVLGGVKIAHYKGLVGHSDADVVIHAVMDALLTACAEKDIGWHFPDTDPLYKGANSMNLLHTVCEIVNKAGFLPTAVSVTVAAEKPKLAPYIDEMRRNVANALCLPVSEVGIAATTTEKLGITGNEEGIAAFATATVCRKPQIHVDGTDKL